MAVSWLLGLLLSVGTAVAFPEYKAELPNIPTVNGSPWPGVGHLSRSGGGLRNQFGKVRSSSNCQLSFAHLALDAGHL